MRRWRRTIALLLLLIALGTSSSAGCAPRIGYAPTPEPLTLRFAFRQNTVDMQVLFDRYHETHPWVTIEPLEARRWGGDIDNLLLAGDIDILRDGRSALTHVAEGRFKVLDDIQLGDWSADRSDYFAGAWEGLAIDGQQWGIPAGVDMQVVYVNVDQAKALKVDIPTADWDLFDLLELALDLNYPEGLPHAESAKLFGFCTAPDSMDPFVFIYLNGGRIVDNLNHPSAATLDEPNTIEGLQFYTDLFTTHLVAPEPAAIKAAFRRGGVYEAAVRGSCGTWIGWYSNRGGKDTGYEWPMSWTMLPLPRGRDAVGLGEVEGYFISSECEHPKEALELIRFLSDNWESAGTKLPPRRSQVESDEYEQAVGEEIADIARQFADRVIMLPNDTQGALNQVGAEVLAATQLIINEDLRASDVLGEAQQRVRPAFQTVE